VTARWSAGNRQRAVQHGLPQNRLLDELLQQGPKPKRNNIGVNRETVCPQAGGRDEAPI